jgi:tRNA(fMet)-specific endonuclease VapC
MFMLDTNIVSDLLRNPFGLAAQRARGVGDAVCISIIVAAELRYGLSKNASHKLRSKIEDLLSELPVMPFDSPADEEYGAIRAQLEKGGRLIGSNDLLIGAHALALGATMVTANMREFTRIPGLKVENWMA